VFESLFYFFTYIVKCLDGAFLHVFTFVGPCHVVLFCILFLCVGPLSESLFYFLPTLLNAWMEPFLFLFTCGPCYVVLFCFFGFIMCWSLERIPFLFFTYVVKCLDGAFFIFVHLWALLRRAVLLFWVYHVLVP
jgi:hypothetical protein